MQTVIYFYVLPVLLGLLAVRGEPKNLSHSALMFIPAINIFLAGAGLAVIARRTYESRGRCLLGHTFIEVRDSEARKERMRAMGVPVACSVAGYERHVCWKCKTNLTVTWKAF